MEIVKLFAPVRPFRFEYGDIVNGITKIEWTERYREADDFKLTAPLESRVDQVLPIGSCITHTESSTIMLVENIEINEASEGEDSMIMISGRSLETMLENRVRGALYFNQSPFPPGHPYGLVWDFWDPFQQWRTGGSTDLEHMWGHYFDNRQLGGDDSDNKWKSADFVYWLMYPFLIYNGQTFPSPADPNDRFYPSGISYPIQPSGDFNLFNPLPSSKMEPRQINSGEGPIYDKMLEILESDNLGIRVMNPRYTKQYHSNTSGLGNPQDIPTTYFYIHAGKVKKDVTFSSYHGDIESAQYLWSNKDYYNDIYIRGTHMAYRLKQAGYTGFGRRTLYADYTEADGHLQDDGIGWYMSLPSDFDEAIWGEGQSNPATGPLGNHSAYAWYLRVFAAMRARAQELLGQHKITATAAVEVKRNLTRYTYRQDFDIGDLVTIDTELVPNSVRRVVEYVEIQDENGYIGYPVLEAPNSVIHGYTAQT